MQTKAHNCFKQGLTLLLLFSALLPASTSALAQTKGPGGVVRISTQSGSNLELYRGSYALVIGVSKYTAGWPILESVPREVSRVSATLRKLGFKVTQVLDPDAERLEQAFDDFIGNYGYQKQNRLLFFFSGHGYSPQGSNKGFLVPTDAPDPGRNRIGFKRKALPMTQVLAWAREMDAKHSLFLFDSCFSGTVFKAKSRPAPRHISIKTAHPVRQFISAGSANQEVPAKSVFAPSLIRGLEGEADRSPKDGYVSGSELGEYLLEKVTYYNPSQTPQYGKIRDPELDQGDFVFVLAGGPGTVPGGPDPRKKRIDKLLTEADALFQRNKLTSPSGANALEKYNQVLRLDPLNRRADAGLQKIVGKYVEWARARYEAGNYTRAESFLASAAKVIENDERVWGLGEQIRKARKKTAEASQQRQQDLARQKAAFEAEQERKAKAEAERKLKETAKGKTFTNSLGMKFVRIPAGSFMMGSNLSPEETVKRYGDKADWYKDEHPQHRVSISKPFYIQTTEVTVGQFRRFAESISYKTDAEKGKGVWTYTGSKWERKAGSSWRDVGFAQGDKHPVVGISWNDAQAFVSWLNKQEGTSKYRLPTEYEWEYAARAGSTTAYCYGDDEGRLGDYAWYAKNSGSQTHPVGQKKPNSWGLYDMHGNVWEWVQDWYGSYSSGSSTDPSGASSGSTRVIRGGSWGITARVSRSADRFRDDPGYSYYSLGFRLARGH